MASSTELSEDQVLAYLSKLSPDAATALLTKASGLSAEQPAEKAEQQTGQPAAERLEAGLDKRSHIRVVYIPWPRKMERGMRQQM